MCVCERENGRAWMQSASMLAHSLSHTHTFTPPSSLSSSPTLASWQHVCVHRRLPDCFVFLSKLIALDDCFAADTELIDILHHRIVQKRQRLTIEGWKGRCDFRCGFRRYTQ